jgi:ABC-type sugar transport system substrate-binding protein
MKKLLVLLMLALFVVTACQPALPVEPVVPAPPEEEVAPAEPTLRDLQGGKPFIYVGNLFAHPTIKMMMLGFWDACKDYDVDCKFIVDPGAAESDWIAANEKAIAYGTSGIDGSGYIGFRQSTLQAAEAGIPVIGNHTNLPPEDTSDVTGLIAWIGPSAELYGADVAVTMKEATNCGSPVIVTQSSFNTTEDAANKGFVDKYSEICPDAVILPVEQEGLEPLEAMNKVSAIITAHPDLKGAFGTTGGSINAWGKALQQAGKKPGEVILIGMDATGENIDMVKAGYAYAIVNQPVYEEHYLAVEILIAHLKGEPYEYENALASAIVKADGLAALEILAARSLTDLPKE